MKVSDITGMPEDQTEPVPQMPGGQQDYSSFNAGGYFPDASMSTLAQQNADLVKWEIDIHDVIRNIEHYLRGEDWDESKKQWVKIGNRLCNEEGIRAFMNILFSRAHKGVILSYFKESDVKNLMKRIDIEVIDKVANDYRRYEIKNSDWTTVRYVIIFNIWAAFNRAIGGRTTDFLSLTQKRIEQVMQSASPQRNRSSIWRWLGGGPN